MAFKGQCFCVSGTFSVTQAKFLKLLKAHGASVSSNVSSSTTHLVASHTGTAKYQAAKQQNIHIVDEDWIREQIKLSSPTKTKAACKKGISPKKARASRRKPTAAHKPVAEIKSEVKKEPTPKQPAGKVKEDIYIRVVDRLCPLPNASVVGEFDAMLNQTNIGGNNNKFYVIQLVQSQLSKSCSPSFYCFTRWGRVGEPGQNAVLGDGTFDSAQEFFLSKFKTKTLNDWNDKDNFVPYPKKYTLIKLKLTAKSKRPLASAMKKEMPRKKAKVKREQPDLHPKVQYLLRYIYGEAKQTLTSKVNVTITNEGINTPLGVLDQGQIEICEEILERAVVQVHILTQQKGSSRKKITELKRTLSEISSEFYTNCPHKTGRTAPPLLDNVDIINEKNELLRLMKDMVNVAARSTADGDENCLHSDDLDEQYRALGCSITYLPPTDPEFIAIQDEIKASQLKSHGQEVARIKTIYRIRREEEHQRYQGGKIGRESLLYHGSRIANWVGLLSRGILQPKAVVAQGIRRTDAGWLGSGIYFGNADTASGYAGKGRENTAFMLVNKVALGKTKDFKKITYGIEKPPQGFHSCRGVPGTEFFDEELVVYDNKQFFSSHLVEFET